MRAARLFQAYALAAQPACRYPAAELRIGRIMAAAHTEMLQSGRLPQACKLGVRRARQRPGADTAQACSLVGCWHTRANLDFAALPAAERA
jgi:hypothetical protein